MRIRMFRSLLVFLIGLAAHPSQASPASPEVTFGIFIGTNNYGGNSGETLGSRVQELHHADDDALDGALTFEHLFPTGKVWLLIDPDLETAARLRVTTERRAEPGAPLSSAATPLKPYIGDVPAQTLVMRGAHPLEPIVPSRGNFNAVVQSLASEVAAARKRGVGRISVILHFAGHGDSDGSLHLADQRVPVSSVLEALAGTGVDRVFALLDACYLALGVPRGAPFTPAPPLPNAGLFKDVSLKRWREQRIFTIAASTPVPEDPAVERGLMSLIGWTCLSGLSDGTDDQIDFAEWGACIRRQLDAARLNVSISLNPSGSEGAEPVVQLPPKSSGVRLERGFFPGRVTVVRASTREVVAEFVHDPRSSARLTLAPDTYELRRMSERSEWKRNDLPAERITVSLNDEIETLPSNRWTVKRVALAQRGVTEPPPDGYEREEISALEEHSLRNSVLNEKAQGTASGLEPSWSFRLGALGSVGGSDLGTSTGGRGIALARLWPQSHWRRWVIQSGVSLGLNDWSYDRIPISSADSLIKVERPELLVGPSLQLHRSGRILRVGLELEGGWSPTALLNEFTTSASPESQALADRYRFLKNGLGALGISLRVPVLPGWEVGPVGRIEGLRWSLPASDLNGVTSAEWQGRAWVGIELRQDALRRR